MILTARVVAAIRLYRTRIRQLLEQHGAGIAIGDSGGYDILTTSAGPAAGFPDKASPDSHKFFWFF
jgi:hypothetical protein